VGFEILTKILHRLSFLFLSQHTAESPGFLSSRCTENMTISEFEIGEPA